MSTIFDKELEAIQGEDPVWILQVKGENFNFIAQTLQDDDEKNAKQLALRWNFHLKLVSALRCFNQASLESNDVNISNARKEASYVLSELRAANKNG
jgi:hypothetical protein